MSDRNDGKRPKGSLKSPYNHESLLNCLLDDLATSGLPLHRNDAATVSRRHKGEGPKFFYRTLKEISGLLLRTLEDGALPDQAVFSCSPDSRAPNFLGGLWRRIIDETGALQSSDNSFHVECVKALLQIGSLFSKYADAFPKEMIPAYLDDFVNVDAAIRDVKYDPKLISVAKAVINEALENLDLRSIRPKHGPGAVATGERDEHKWEFKRLYNVAHQAYPYYENFVVGGSLELLDRAKWYRGLERLESGTAKVLIVPKSADSLRVISMEPLENQFLQQGQKDKFVQHLQRHPLTRGHVNFDDQTVNRNLALVNSRTRDYATIDLSAASDRLSLELVKRLFYGVEDNVYRYLVATRSTHTILPDGRVVEMQKFAPMGSAVCFPVQSICFFALCVAAISIATNETFAVVFDRVYVYGDDIIVPSEHVDCVAEALESVGLKVNIHKSFRKGFFRESCGIFAYHGVDITPVRLKTSFPRNRGDGRGIAAWLSYANAFEDRGYRESAEYIYTTIESLIGKLPYGLPGCSYFCRRASSEADLAIRNSTWPRIRWNDRLQRIEIHALGLSTRYRDVEFSSGWHRLFRDLLTSYVDSDPSKTVVARSVKPKAAWHSLL
jgi:hypothetical protein